METKTYLIKTKYDYSTNELVNDYTGITERHAYRRQYDTTSSFTFYVDHDYKIINFFEKWIGYIVGENETNTATLNDGKLNSERKSTLSKSNGVAKKLISISLQKSCNI